MKLTGENRSTQGKTCPSATFSTTNPTWTDPGSNPALRVERPATHRLAMARPMKLPYQENCFSVNANICICFNTQVCAAPHSLRER
jgi:hypothetical protein